MWVGQSLQRVSSVTMVNEEDTGSGLGLQQVLGAIKVNAFPWIGSSSPFGFTALNLCLMLKISTNQCKPTRC